MTAAARGYEADYWWMLLLQGIATLVLGALLVIEPDLTTVVILQFMGAYWLINGIFAIIQIFIRDTAIHWAWLLLSGLLGILAGLFVLEHPVYSSVLIPTTLIYVIAIQGIVVGAISLFQGIRGGGWGAIIWGAISVIFGIILLSEPILAASALPVIMGVFGLISGVVMILFAFRLRPA